MLSPQSMAHARSSWDRTSRTRADDGKSGQNNEAIVSPKLAMTVYDHVSTNRPPVNWPAPEVTEGNGLFNPRPSKSTTARSSIAARQSQPSQRRAPTNQLGHSALPHPPRDRGDAGGGGPGRQRHSLSVCRARVAGGWAVGRRRARGSVQGTLQVCVRLQRPPTGAPTRSRQPGSGSHSDRRVRSPCSLREPVQDQIEKGWAWANIPAVNDSATASCSDLHRNFRKRQHKEARDAHTFLKRLSRPL